MTEIIKNAVTCSLCGSPADRHGSTLFQCQNNPGHIADTLTGIFSDNSFPGDAEHKPDNYVSCQHSTGS